MLLFIVALALSLPNLVAGAALLLIGPTFAGRSLFQILDDFFSRLYGGAPIAAGALIVLLLAGCITETRPYAAVCVFALNVAALFLVLTQTGAPNDLSHAVIFAPALLALGLFAWLGYVGFARKTTPEPLLS